MRDGVIAPHLLPDENLFRVVGKPVVLDASGVEIEPGSWFAPAGVDIQCAFEVTNFKDALDQCGLTSNDALEVVVQVAGREVRSRYTVTRKVLRRSGTIQIGGSVPYGHTDELMKMTVTVQLKNASKASTPAPNKPGAILWMDEKPASRADLSTAPSDERRNVGPAKEENPLVRRNRHGRPRKSVHRSGPRAC